NTDAPAALADVSLAEFRLQPDYPSPSPLDEMLRLAMPGTDAFVTEKYAAQLQAQFEHLRQAITNSSGAQPRDLAPLLHESLVGNELNEGKARSVGLIELRRYACKEEARVARETFATWLAGYFSSLGRVRVAEFEITGLKLKSPAPVELDAEVRYTLVGVAAPGGREQRIGLWRMSWRQTSDARWLASRWSFVDETRAKAPAPLFADMTTLAL